LRCVLLTPNASLKRAANRFDSGNLTLDDWLKPHPIMPMQAIRKLSF
jgi:hypothetical protein